MKKIEVKETYRIGTEEEVKAFIEECKAKAYEDGYILNAYTSTLKEKKCKGEVVDLGFNVTVTKKYNNFWEAE